MSIEKNGEKIIAPNFSEWVRYIEDYKVSEDVSEYWNQFEL